MKILQRINTTKLLKHPYILSLMNSLKAMFFLYVYIKVKKSSVVLPMFYVPFEALCFLVAGYCCQGSLGETDTSHAQMACNGNKFVMINDLK